MDGRLDRELTRGGGAGARWLLLRAGVPRHVIDSEVRRGSIVRVFPGAYVRTELAEDHAVRETAAVLALRTGSGVSHLSALRHWGLDEPPPAVHLLVRNGAALPTRPTLVTHRATAFPPMRAVGRGELSVPYVAPADTVVQSWPLLEPGERRATVIEAVRQRLATADELTEALGRHRVRDRRELTELVGLLAQGCESEFEIFGLVRVFDVDGLRQAERQRWVRTRLGWVRLDVAYADELVAVELDGEAYHSTREQRERDRARDAALAAEGWLVVRFTYARMTADPDWCRRELLQILAVRRRLLRRAQ